MKTSIKRTIKEVKQAIPVSVVSNEPMKIVVTSVEEKAFIKKLAKKHMIAKRREDELKQLKQEFLTNIIGKYVTDADKERILKQTENKYIEVSADSDSVRNNIQYSYEYDNDMLLEIAQERNVLSKVAKVSIKDIRPFFEKGEEKKVTLSKSIQDKITVTKK
jgi:D-arabinose 1-dehydrogenase-like Zn-dependent alcohol dehydrogenase